MPLSSRSVSASIAGVLLAVLLGAAAIVVFVRHATSGASARLAGLLTGRTEHFDMSVPVVVQHIQRLSRLETVVYSLDTVVEGDRSVPVLPDLLAGDRILLVVHGESIAGIDLAQLKPEDVESTQGQPRHPPHPPPSQLFVTALDNQHTRVYSRTTGLLVPEDRTWNRTPAPKPSSSSSRRRSQDGILDAARKNARATITALLYSLGFQQVDVSR